MVKKRWFAVVVVAALAVLFAGCSRPESPQQVAAEFWQAVTEGDAGAVTDLSTLTDAGSFNGFGSNWAGTLPDFGRIVIDADQATIVTRVTTENGAAAERRELLTHLVRINDQWLVDYQSTRDAVMDRPALSGLMNDIERLGQQLDQAVGETSDKLSKQVDEMAKEFRTYSEETGQKAEEALDDFGKSLEELRQKIKKSLQEAEKKRQETGQSDQLEQV
ncbi:hypothetical protein [Marinobacter halotolerans]|uniref:hypothetical protein n=1 Tax=Marinobacter halotolerans TaxID=1569211 RepID=UPI001246936A|nr:hypothetical protein [Marinobacter halotolerans]